MWDDLRCACRQIRQYPGFTAAAIAALAVGIAVNTSMFSVADVLLFRPFLFPDLDRIVWVASNDPESPDLTAPLAPADFRDMRQAASSVEHLSAFVHYNANLTGEGDPERVQAYEVMPELFQALNGRAKLGRTFTAEDVDGPPVLLLSYATWMSRYAADPAIIGKQVHVNGIAHSIVGVMPQDFNFPVTVQVWTPLRLDPRQWSKRDSRFMWAVARLKPGFTIDNARAEFATMAAQLADRFPQTNRDRSARVVPLRYRVSGDLTRGYTLFTLGGVAFVLLIACANVANLQLARATRRVHEIAIRAAMGAGRWRLIRQLLVENLVLCAAAALIAVFLAAWLNDLIRGAMPPDVTKFLPGWERLGINGHGLAYTTALALSAAFLSGLAPAWNASRVDLQAQLKEGGRSGRGGPRRSRARELLVVGEVALALVLLAGAGLMVKGFVHLVRANDNVRPETLLTFRVSLPQARYAGGAQITSFFDRALERLGRMPGVQGASAVSNLPYTQSWNDVAFEIEGRPFESGIRQPIAVHQSVGPGYFSLVSVPLEAGRLIDQRDGPASQPVALISRRLALRYMGNDDPIGRRIRLRRPNSPWLTIVGVVSDLRQDPYQKDVLPTLYRPYSQEPERSMDLAIRTSGDPYDLVNEARSAIRAIDPLQPIYQVKSLAQARDECLVGFWFVAVVLAATGAIGVVLAGIGIAGLLAWWVAQRRHEIGVRLTLGAQPEDILRLIVGGGMRLAAVGVVIGTVGALLLTRLIAGLVFGASAQDPLVFGAVILFLSIVALAACAIPARAASEVDPLLSIRYE